MSKVLKKALGLFVDFDEKEQPEGGTPEGDETAATAEAPVVLADVPADLSQDPDVARVAQAGQLVASLPLEGIAVEKARELVARTLQFAGVELADLEGAFARARALYQAQIQQEQTKISERQRLYTERMKVLEEAMAEEKRAAEAEVGARTGRIEEAGAALTDMEKSMAFFLSKDESGEQA